MKQQSVKSFEVSLYEAFSSGNILFVFYVTMAITFLFVTGQHQAQIGIVV